MRQQLRKLAYRRFVLPRFDVSSNVQAHGAQLSSVSGFEIGVAGVASALIGMRKQLQLAVKEHSKKSAK
jgi:hypothetical protein